MVATDTTGSSMAMFTVAVQGFGPVRAHGDRLRGGRILPDEPVVTADGDGSVRDGGHATGLGDGADVVGCYRRVVETYPSGGWTSPTFAMSGPTSSIRSWHSSAV